MKIKGKLTSDSLKMMADELQQYATDFQAKIQLLTQRLADKGVIVGQTTIGNFGKYVTFSRHTNTHGVVVVAQETDIIISRWLRKGSDEPIKAEVSPLLMAEFGAGPHAIIWEGTTGSTEMLSDGTKIGRGSFKYPDQIQTHAFESSWWYMDLNKQWHQASGVKPTRPLHNAMLEIINTVSATAREVFGNGRQ